MYSCLQGILTCAGEKNSMCWDREHRTLFPVTILCRSIIGEDSLPRVADRVLRSGNKKVQDVDLFIRQVDKRIQSVDKKVHLVDKEVHLPDKNIHEVDMFLFIEQIIADNVKIEPPCLSC